MSNVRYLSLARSIAQRLISRVIRKVIAMEQQYIKDLNFIEEVLHGSRDALVIIKREADIFLQGFHPSIAKRASSHHSSPAKCTSSCRSSSAKCTFYHHSRQR